MNCHVIYNRILDKHIFLQDQLAFDIFNLYFDQIILSRILFLF